MDTGLRQGLVLGAIVGVFIGVALWLYTDVVWCLLLIPFTAIMGAAPQLIKPKDEEPPKRK